MTTRAKQISKLKPEDFDRPEIKNAVKTLLEATAYAQAMREDVDAKVYRPALHYDDGRPMYSSDPKYGEVRPITDRKDAWTMLEADWDDYHGECQHRIKQEADKNPAYRVPKDCCPAAMAEELQRQATRALIIACEPVTGIDDHSLLCAGLDVRQQYVDNICGLVVSQFPDYFERK